jgi:hypothetical protein
VSVAADCIRHAGMNEDPPSPAILPKPWWQSVGFWLGAFVAVFWVWVLIQSIGWATCLNHARPLKIHTLRLEDGSLQWIEIDTPLSHALDPGWTATRTRLAHNDRSAGRVMWGFWCWNHEEPVDFALFTTRVSIPIWVILVAWMVLWHGGLAWWRRRPRRRIDPTAFDPPESGGE